MTKRSNVHEKYDSLSSHIHEVNAIQLLTHEKTGKRDLVVFTYK